MTMLRASFGDLLAPGFREIFFNKFSEYPLEMEQIFNLRTSNRQYEKDSYVSGFGLVPKKTEGTPSTYDDPIQGYATEYTHDTYSLAYRVTKEMGEDDLYRIVSKMPASLGRSMRITIDTDGANQLNNAETAGKTGGDGLTLLNTAHTLANGGTQKNRLTSAADLAMSSLEQALIDISETLDDRSLPMHLIPRKLVVPVELEWTAQKILRSGSDPENANDQYNPARGMLQLAVNHYITDADAWFILCDEHEMNWFWRVRPDHYQDNDFDTDDAKFKVRARWSRGWSIPWGVFGSMGR